MKTLLIQSQTANWKETPTRLIERLATTPDESDVSMPKLMIRLAKLLNTFWSRNRRIDRADVERLKRHCKIYWSRWRVHLFSKTIPSHKMRSSLVRVCSINESNVDKTYGNRSIPNDFQITQSCALRHAPISYRLRDLLEMPRMTSAPKSNRIRPSEVIWEMIDSRTWRQNDGEEKLEQRWDRAVTASNMLCLRLSRVSSFAFSIHNTIELMRTDHNNRSLNDRLAKIGQRSKKLFMKF